MRVLLDMQGAQGASAGAGVGRYVLELARAMARGRGPHALQLLVNTTLAETAQRIAHEFAPILGDEAIRRFAGPAGVAAGREPLSTLRALAERLRAEAVCEARAELLLLGSLFEGWRDEAVVTWPNDVERVPTAAVLHDLIPLSLRGLYLDGAWGEGGLVPWYARGLDEAAAATMLLCNSEATRAEALAHLPTPRERLAVIGGGVSADFAAPARPDASLLPRLGLRPGFLLALGMGDLRKDASVLLDAYAALPDAMRARHPLAIGHVNPPALRDAAAGRGLSEQEVILLPRVAEADLPGLYAATALFIFPSLAEGFGLPALEAMACGAPVIASNRPALPEVLGRADALFHPDDAPGLSRLIATLLSDPQRRRDLAEYGPRRAREFSWDGAAARAWQALDGITLRGMPRRPRSRPRLAIVSPVPPAPTGVADYTAELALSLRAHYAVTLVSAAPPDGPLRGLLPWMEEARFERTGGRFDRVLYQIGNNPLHAVTLSRLLPRHPGVVTLHDPALTDLRHWMLTDRAARERALGERVLEQGYPAALSGRMGMGSAGLLAEALGVIVHSAHARERLRAEYGAVAARHVEVLPHLRAPVALPGREAARAALGLGAGVEVVTAFGLVTPRKTPLALLLAFAELARKRPEAILVYAGGTTDGLDAVLRAQAARLGLSARVTITGRLPVEGYRNWLSASDLAVQLRNDSTGETSGAVKDAMAAGLATLVNAHGAMAELPTGACRKLPDAFTEVELGAAILSLLEDSAMRASLGEAAARWVREALAPEPIARRVRDLIEDAHIAGPQAGLVAFARDAAGEELSEEEAAGLGLAMAQTWPGPRTPRLWLDTATPGLAPGIERMLRDGVPGFRPEPAQLRGRQLWTDHAWAWPRLEMAGPPPEDGPAILAPGDALISATHGAGPLARLWGARLLPVPEGTNGERQRAALLGRLGF